ncbi:MAG: histidine phosphatase family protein [Gammaproteobacteria bacterium]
MIKLLIARHGNTFDQGDVVLRVGCGTDLPLSNSGQEQAKKLRQFLSNESITQVYCSPLKRTQETARLASDIPFEIREFLNEVDYGPDEGKPETDVVARLGEQALKQWETHAVVPKDWNVRPEVIIQAWKDFAEELVQHQQGKTILVVTSNGIARFAPYITGNFEAFCQAHNIKLSTGKVGCLVYDDTWKVAYWNRSL